MKTNIQRKGKHALLLTREEITAIIGEIEIAYGDIAIQARCIEGSELITDNPADILNYENPNFRRLESLKIQGGIPYEEGCLINIEERLSNTFTLSISDTNDARALKVATDLENRIKDCKPWYSFLTRFSLATLIAVVYFVLATIKVLQVVYKYGLFPKTPDVSYVIFIYLLIPITLIYFSIVTIAQKGWEWIFPKVSFSLGRQVGEFEKRSKIRKLILGGVFGSLVLGVAGNIISHFLLK